MADNGTRVLLVEDEPTSRRLLQEILEGRGHQVDVCPDGETGWAAFQRYRHPVAVLDWKLPGIDGLELCRRMRRLAGPDETYILFVTGLDRRDALEEAIAAGASDYLVKSALPFEVHPRLAIAERHVVKEEERRRAESEMAREVLQDPVTELASRALFLERLDRAARRAVRSKDHLFAVLAVKPWEYGAAAERLSRESADRLLRDVAHRLEGCVRNVDTAGRLSGDDFAILLDGMSDLSDASRVARRLHEALARPFAVGDDEVVLGGCVGVAISLTGYTASADLLLDALKALQRATEDGPGSTHTHDPVMHARATARVQLETRIQRALSAGEFVLFYQPIVSMETGRAVAFEALLRWNDPDRGLVNAQEFLPVAEESGLTVPLGTWVVRSALAQLAHWRTRTPHAREVGMRVNLSPRQFAQPDVFDHVEAALKENRLTGDDLRLEITEACLMGDPDATQHALERLEGAGVALHLDDFGLGYSSFSHLGRFPIEALKVDRSFVSEMTHSPGNRDVVAIIVRLAHNLGMTVVAEGVETDPQRRLLQDMGCDLAQGFLFSRPLEAHQVPGWLTHIHGQARGA